MGSHVVRIDGAAIHDWVTFHEVFATALGFPSFYGRNLDAWIDCLTCADDRDAGMIANAVPAGEVLTLQIDSVDDLATRCPEQYAAIVDCAAFVNWRRLERGHGPVLALSFCRR
jgi:Barstar (barnase inhibitor)